MAITPTKEERKDLAVELICIFTVGRVVLGTTRAKTVAGKKRDIVMMLLLKISLEGAPTTAVENEEQEWLDIQ